MPARTIQTADGAVLLVMLGHIQVISRCAECPNFHLYFAGGMQVAVAPSQATAICRTLNVGPELLSELTPPSIAAVDQAAPKVN